MVTQNMSNQSDEHDHLSDIDDGAGCTEIWEKLSERRDQHAASAGRQVETEGNAQ